MAINLNPVSTPVGATVSSPGLGSGINVSQLVTSLVNATITPQQTLLQNQQATDQANISALGAVQSALFGLQASVGALTTGGALGDLTATSSNTSTFSAVASSSAVAGSYSVEVQALAQSNTISSAAYSSASAVVGNGGVTLSAGGSSFTVQLSGSNDTLQDLANAINSAPNNSGVSASIITSTDGAHLVLSSTETGTANQVSVSSPLLAAFSTVQSASNAQIFVDGYEYDSPSNTITGALSGVTINLLQAQPNTNLTLNVSPDIASAASAIASFVTAYNTASSLLLSDTSYDSSTGQAGPLLGNSGVTSALQQMQGIEASQVSTNGSNAITTLSQLGISVNADGSLSLDTNALNAALSSNLTSVQNLLSGPNGIMTQLNTMVENVAGSTGVLSSQEQAYQTDYSNAAQQLTSLQAESQQLTQRYTSEFNSMNTVVSQYNSLSSMLTQTFASWNNVTTNSSSSNG